MLLFKELNEGSVAFGSLIVAINRNVVDVEEAFGHRFDQRLPDDVGLTDSKVEEPAPFQLVSGD